MLARMKVALAAVLVAASASTALAAGAKHKVTHRAPVSISQGRHAAAFAPFTADERRWFDRASMPSNQ
jgi:hypothetical protein